MAGAAATASATVSVSMGGASQCASMGAQGEAMAGFVPRRARRRVQGERGGKGEKLQQQLQAMAASPPVSGLSVEKQEEEEVLEAMAFRRASSGKEGAAERSSIGQEEERERHTEEEDEEEEEEEEEVELRAMVGERDLMENHPRSVKKEMEEILDDVALSLGTVVDSDTCSVADAGAHDLLSWPDSALDFSLDSLGGGEVHDIELTEEDALLLGGMQAEGVEEMEQQHMQGMMQRGGGGGEEESAVTQSVEGGRGQEGGLGEEESGGNGKGNKTAPGRRKMKVDWTPELHRRFVQAVEQLGVEKAIPSRILELMGVQCLTRHNIASHLQKYRSHRRHLIAREAEAATWHQRRPLDPSAWSRMRRDGSSWVHPSHTAPPRIQPRPTLGLPQLQPHPSPPIGHPISHPPAPPAVGMPLYVWGHPTVDHSPAHMWQQPPPTWYAPDGMWQYPMTSMDASWGHPSGAVQGTPCFSQQVPRLMSAPSVVCGSSSFLPSAMLGGVMGGESLLCDDVLNEPLYSSLADDFDLFIEPGDEPFSTSGDASRSILDEAISKALADPLTPLPLGLKPPSMEKVMAELQRQGITTAAPLSPQQPAPVAA